MKAAIILKNAVTPKTNTPNQGNMVLNSKTKAPCMSKNNNG